MKLGCSPQLQEVKLDTINIDVWLYGPLTQYGGDAARKSHANLVVNLPAGSSVQDLLNRLSMPTEERGLTFINGDLSAMQGVQPDLDQILEDGDRVAFFHLKSMWPAQYRDGVSMAEGMKTEIESGKRFHHRHQGDE